MNSDNLNMDQLIGDALPVIDDGGFSDAVLGKVKRQIWTRRLVLSAAVISGIALALPFLSDLVFAISDQLVVLANQWNEIATAGNYPVVLSTIPARDALLHLSSLLVQIGANWKNPDWLMQFGAVLPAGLLALLSPLLLRLLER